MSDFGKRAPVRASLFVRDKSPRRSESFGSFPVAFIRCRSFWVLYVPALTINSFAVKVFVLRKSPFVFLALTIHEPSDACSKEVTVVSGNTFAPADSANPR